jgi:hypothetical protein
MLRMCNVSAHLALGWMVLMVEFIYFLSHSFLMMTLGAWFARKHI